MPGEHREGQPYTQKKVFTKVKATEDGLTTTAAVLKKVSSQPKALACAISMRRARGPAPLAFITAPF